MTQTPNDRTNRSESRLRIGLAVLCVLAAGVTLLLAFRPPASNVHTQREAARVAFQIEPGWVPALDTCASVTWQVDGIREVYLDEAPVVGSGQAENCAPVTTPSQLRVIYQDGVEQVFRVSARLEPLRSTQTWFWLATSGGLLVVALWLVAAPEPREKARARVRAVGRAGIRLLTPERLAVLIVLAGALLRIQEFLVNRPLWADEAVLSLNVLNRDWLGLLQPLDYGQGAPLGYLWSLKLATELFGVSEYSLRALSLIASIGTLVLLLAVARRLLDRWAVPLALLIFAVADMQVYYASEIKQYALDGFVTLALILIALDLLAKPASWRRLAIWSGLGAVLLLFSQPAIFVVAGMGGTLALNAAQTREARRWWKLAPVGVWLVTFVALYWFAYRSLNDSTFLNDFWTNAFAPYEMERAFAWLWERLTSSLAYAASLTLFGSLAVVGFIIGAGRLFGRNRDHGLLLVLPILFALGAALFRLYPFEGRLLLFLTPLLTLGVAQGIYTLIARTPEIPSLARGLAWVAVLIPLLMMAAPNPSTTPDIRPALLHIRDAGDEPATVYTFGGMSAVYLYYAQQYGLAPAREIEGRLDHLLDGQIPFSTGERVWIFRRGEDDPEGWQQTLDWFEANGEPIDQFTTPGGAAIAYQID